MTYRLEITAAAHADMADAYGYYEKKRVGLGEDFLNEVTGQFAKLAEAPLNYSYIGNSNTLRDVKVKRFPYVIVFLISEDIVAVVAVHCTWRRPLLP